MFVGGSPPDADDAAQPTLITDNNNNADDSVAVLSAPDILPPPAAAALPPGAYSMRYSFRNGTTEEEEDGVIDIMSPRRLLIEAHEVIEEETDDATNEAAREHIRQEMREEMIADLVVAIPAGEDQSPNNDNNNNNNNNTTPMIIFASIILVIIIGVIVGHISGSRENSEMTMLATNNKTEEQELVGMDYLRSILSPISGNESLYNQTTPQYKAMDWLLNRDNASWSLGETISSSLLTNNNTELDKDTVIERYVMALFYYTTGGPKWTDQLRFMSNYSVCEWPAVGRDYQYIGGTISQVVCNENDNVVRIDLMDNNLNGTLPSELSALNHLERLSIIYSPNLHGTLPDEFGHFANLRLLQFWVTGLHGTIPQSFTRLREIDILSLAFNRFSGSLPSFEALENLEMIVLMHNSFNGTLPALKLRSKLTGINIEYNRFEGSIPTSWFSQSNLNALMLNSNQLEGTIGQNIEGLERLDTLYLDNNKFTGVLPTSLGKFEYLKDMMIHNNRFSGTIPSELGKMVALENIDISHNRFSGPLPSELGEMKGLSQLWIASNNNITGVLPSTLGRLQVANLKSLSLEDTSISGGIEEGFCNEFLSTRISADCDKSGVFDNRTGNVECTCCTSCCGDDFSETEIAEHHGNNDFVCSRNLGAQCEIYKNGLERPALGDAFCRCSKDGTMLRCTDVECESCDIDGNFCARNTNFGYDFNSTSSDIIRFQNTIQYHSMQYMGNNNNNNHSSSLTMTFVQQLVDDIPGTYTYELYVEGQKCKHFEFSTCKDGMPSPRIDCENVRLDQFGERGFRFNTCDVADDVGYLEVFSLTHMGNLNGCGLKLDRHFV